MEKTGKNNYFRIKKARIHNLKGIDIGQHV